jgi:hypothetical protein
MLFRGYVVLTVVELCFYWESRVLKEKSQAHGLSEELAGKSVFCSVKPWVQTPVSPKRLKNITVKWKKPWMSH